jgi:hypothetical protein
MPKIHRKTTSIVGQFGKTLLLACTLLCTLGAAAEPQTLAGVWQGHIGKAAVMVCVTPSGRAEYYYLKHQVGLPLHFAGETDPERSQQQLGESLSGERWALDEMQLTPRWEPPQVNGHWSLNAEEKDTLHGRWTDLAGKRDATIHLTRLANAEAQRGDECPPVFYAPLGTGVPLKRSPARFQEHPYVEVRSPQATGMEVPADTPHAKRINRWAEGWLASQSGIAYECQMQRGAVEPPLGSRLSPVTWNRHFLVLQDAMPDTYCGGAHGSFSIDHITWSLDLGQTIDIWSWLKNGQKSIESQKSADGEPRPSALMELIQKHHPSNTKGDDCADVMNSVNVSDPYPTDAGLVFPTTFFHAMRACGDDVHLSWKQLAPHLSPAGQAARKLW